VAMHEPLRFKDGDRTWSWYSDVLVFCPRCNERALVHRAGDAAYSARLVCDSCSLVEQRNERFPIYYGRPVDPFFGFPLWLQAQFRNHVLWAYNREHAELLLEFVAANLRERAPDVPPGSRSDDRSETMTMIETQPKWIKAAKNRESLVALLYELLAKAE